MAIACDSSNRRIVPLHFGVWPTGAPNYRSGNEEIGRQMKYAKLRNMASPVLAVSYFAAAWLGHGERIAPHPEKSEKLKVEREK